MCFAWTSFSFMDPGDWTTLLEEGTGAEAARPVVEVSDPPEPKVIIVAMPGPSPKSTQGQELKPQHLLPTTVIATHTTYNPYRHKAKVEINFVRHK